MSLSMSQHAGSLCEVLSADVTLIRSDPSVSEHVLVEIAGVVEHPLADGASRARSVLRAFVTAEREGRGEDIVTEFALEAILVHEQVVVQVVTGREFLRAKIATIAIDDFLRHPLVLPFVMGDVPDDLAADFTDVRDVHVGLLDVDTQVDLQLETLPAVVAHELRIHGTVHANLVIFQTCLAFVLHMTHGALQVRTVLVRLLVLFQAWFRRVAFVTFVARVSFLVKSTHVPLHRTLVLEDLLTNWTDCLQILQYLVCLFF